MFNKPYFEFCNYLYLYFMNIDFDVLLLAKAEYLIVTIFQATL